MNPRYPADGSALRSGKLECVSSPHWPDGPPEVNPEIARRLAASGRVQDIPAGPRSKYPPIRPSIIFWGLVILTLLAGLWLWSFQDNGWVRIDASDRFAFTGFERNEKFAIFCFAVLGWVVSLTFHEFGHALAAWLGGDHTVEKKGYLNLDPRKYTDIGLSLVMPVIIMMLGFLALPGGAVWIQRNLIRSRAWLSFMSAAGPLSNVIFAALTMFPVATGLVTIEENTALAVGLAFVSFLQISAAVLNLIPVPGLDGYGIIEPWLSDDLQKSLGRYRASGMWILMGALFFIPAARDFFWDDLVIPLYEGLGGPGGAIGEGFSAFRFWS